MSHGVCSHLVVRVGGSRRVRDQPDRPEHVEQRSDDGSVERDPRLAAAVNARVVTDEVDVGAGVAVARDRTTVLAGVGDAEGVPPAVRDGLHAPAVRAEAYRDCGSPLSVAGALVEHQRESAVLAGPGHRLDPSTRG